MPEYSVKELCSMDKLRVQVNGRGYYLKTDKPEEVLAFAKEFEDKISYITSKMAGISEAEATALSALIIMGDSLKKERSEEDQALIEELTGKIEVLEERTDTLTRQLAVHNESEIAMKAEITALKEKEQGLIEELSGAAQKEQELNGLCSDNENALNDVKSALASANKIIAQLNTEKFTEVAANEALRKELEASRERLETANKAIAELNGKITKMEINSYVASDGTVTPPDEELKKVRNEKEELEIELAIANEEIEKLKAASPAAPADEQLKKTIAEYERTIRQLESRSGEIDKLRSLLAETEQSVKQKADEKETENQKLRNILKNYENSYGICVAKKEEEIKELQQEIEKLKNALNIKNEEKMNSSYVQTTFES